MDSDAEDGYSDEEYMPSIWSSAKGKRRRLWSLTPIHPSKVHRRETGLSTPVQMYQVQAPGGLATPILTPTSRLVHPSPAGPAPSPMGPFLSVFHQPIPGPVLGTATYLVDLDQSTLDQKYPDADQEPPTVVPEQPTVDLNQYRWLFTAAKGEKEAAVNVGLTKYKLALESFRQACELQTVGMTGCINYSSDLEQYLGVCPKDLAKGGPNPQKAE
jgi:hypothetical protein